MRIIASLDPAEVPARVGERSASTVHLTSAEPGARDLRVQVDGLGAGWTWVVPSRLRLAGGESATVRVVFQVPRRTRPPAGPLAFSVSVSDPGAADAMVVVPGTLDVAPVTDLFVSLLAAPTADAAGRHRLSVENRGNVTVRADLEGSAVSEAGAPLEDAPAVLIDPGVITVEPGATAEAVVTTAPPARRRFGPGRDIHRMQVVVRPDGAPPTTVTGTVRRPHRASPRRRAAAAAVVVVVVAGALGLQAALDDGEDTGSTGTAAGAAEDGCPAEGRLGSATHAGGEVPPASGYTFLDAAGGDGCLPARFNPCEAVAYVLNDTLAPPGGVDEVREALARVAEATGLTFIEEGTTDEALLISRPPYQPERYGDRWAPILIGWSALGSEPIAGSADDVIVVGRGRPLEVAGVYVSGVLELNVDAVRDRASGEPLPGGFGPGITTGRVILHELGHVVGLGHPSSPAQLMFAELAAHTSATAEFGIGDLAGLRHLGAEAGCVEVPPLPEPSPDGE